MTSEPPTTSSKDTLAPICRQRCAMQRPMPLAPPVTSTCLSIRLSILAHDPPDDQPTKVLCWCLPGDGLEATSQNLLSSLSKRYARAATNLNGGSRAHLCPKGRKLWHVCEVENVWSEKPHSKHITAENVKMRASFRMTQAAFSAWQVGPRMCHNLQTSRLDPNNLRYSSLQVLGNIASKSTHSPCSIICPADAGMPMLQPSSRHPVYIHSGAADPHLPQHLRVLPAAVMSPQPAPQQLQR